MTEYYETKLYLKRKNQLEIVNSPDKYCPVCFYKLVKKKSGMVCKNWRCPIYWKYKGFAWNDSDENIRFMERVITDYKKCKYCNNTTDEDLTNVLENPSEAYSNGKRIGWSAYQQEDKIIYICLKCRNKIILGGDKK